MKWIDQSYEILEQGPGIQGMYEQIERAGRICYKSVGTRYFKVPKYIKNDAIIDSIIHTATRDKDGLCILKNYFYYISIPNVNIKKYSSELKKYEVIDPNNAVDPFHAFTNVTAKPFTENVLKKSGHWAMLEHGTVFLTVPLYRLDIFFRYAFNKYSRSKVHGLNFLITTNYRVVSEKKAENDLKFFSKDTCFHYRRPCVRFVMDRVGSQSVERHRGKYGISFAQESTRYCNYSKGKFGGLTFIIPRWMYKLRDKLAGYVDPLTKVSNDVLIDYTSEEMVMRLACADRSVSTYVDSCQKAEEDYIFLTTTDESERLQPQDARGILPLQVKTEFVMTAYDIDWKHFFELRMDSHAHPDIQWISTRLHSNNVFKNL